MGGAEAEVRTALKDQLGLDPAESLEVRTRAGSVVKAWIGAREQRSRDVQLRAESRASGLVKPISTQEYTGMKKAFELLYPKLAPQLTPSRAYISAKLKEVEDGEPRAESGREVLTKEDTEEAQISSTIDPATGRVAARLSTRNGRMPKHPEELRTYHRVMSTCYIFCKLKHSNRIWLQDLTPEVFVRFSDFVLGLHVLGLESMVDSVSYHPSWDMVTHLEHELRKKACDYMEDDDKTLKEALEMACKDSETKQLHLLTPFQLSLIHI